MMLIAPHSDLSIQLGHLPGWLLFLSSALAAYATPAFRYVVTSIGRKLIDLLLKLVLRKLLHLRMKPGPLLYGPDGRRLTYRKSKS